MSSVTFQSPSGAADLRGSERAYAGIMVNDLAFSQMSIGGIGWRTEEWKKRDLRLLPAGHYLHGSSEQYLASGFKTWFTGFSGADDFLPLGDPAEIALTPFQICLNTAIFCFGDAIELLARMHATCEINGWFEGEHREWMADIIDEGRRRNVLRPTQGWEDVSEFLRSCDDEPVVMTYSVTQGFPEAYFVHQAGLWTPPTYPDSEFEDYTEDELAEVRDVDRLNWDEWYEVPEHEQWELGMKALRQTGTGQVDINPDVWGKRGFGRGEKCWTIFDLENWLDEQERSDV